MTDELIPWGTEHIPAGEERILDYEWPFRFYIRTTNGTVIEGTSFPNTPLKITVAAHDIAQFTIYFEKDHFSPVHLVE